MVEASPQRLTSPNDFRRPSPRRTSLRARARARPIALAGQDSHRTESYSGFAGDPVAVAVTACVRLVERQTVDRRVVGVAATGAVIDRTGPRHPALVVGVHVCAVVVRGGGGRGRRYGGGRPRLRQRGCF